MVTVVTTTFLSQKTILLSPRFSNYIFSLFLAVFGTIGIVTVFYCFASLALVGMQNYTEINLDSGFSSGHPPSSHCYILTLSACNIRSLI